jgi:uncharacterized protein YuzE
METTDYFKNSVMVRRPYLKVKCDGTLTLSEGDTMIFKYYPSTDMLYIELAKGISIESQEVAPNLVLDFNADHRVIGIEIEDASQLVELSRLELSALPLANLLITQVPTGNPSSAPEWPSEKLGLSRK